MIGKIFLVHWNGFDVCMYAEQLRMSGWEVAYEVEDGARAGSRFASLFLPPDS